MVGNCSDHQLEAEAVLVQTNNGNVSPFSLFQSSSQYLTWQISSLLKIHSKSVSYTNNIVLILKSDL